ncbi:hypothetical protein ACIQMV_23190 [Streptomyces sp. NPDC091412]|uniref:hypothetical protein n=1 Tax=Streptomyces sp. NPDC091412 TaxID=3366002 RepID=UPI003814448E
MRRLILVLAAARPGVLRIPHFSVMGAAVVLGAAVPVTAAVRGPLRSRCRPMVAAVPNGIATVHSRPRRAAALWGGPLAFAGRGAQRRAAAAYTPAPIRPAAGETPPSPTRTSSVGLLGADLTGAVSSTSCPGPRRRCGRAAARWTARGRAVRRRGRRRAPASVVGRSRRRDRVEG